jgi:glycerate 2-kinase
MDTPTGYKNQSRLEQIKNIYAAGLERVKAEQALRCRLDYDNNFLMIDDLSWDLNSFEKVLVLGAGKAAGTMAESLEEILGDHIDTGLVITSDGNSRPTKRIKIREAGHPVPDERSRKAAGELTTYADAASSDTLVLFLLSGGASALLTLPVNSISLNSVQHMTNLLLHAGADIGQINTVRKQISAVKGGNLAKRLFPATVVTLSISDVLGSPPSVIGSGPTVADSSTVADAIQILENYKLLQKVDSSIRDHLLESAAVKHPDNASLDHPCFQKASYHILAENRNALEAAKEEAVLMGFDTHILSDNMYGEARLVVVEHIGEIKNWLQQHNPKTPQCFLYGGETTVTVQGSGRGGRNQEYVLAAIELLPQLGDILILSAGTDGIDGPTDAAGAWADAETEKRAGKLNLDLHAELQQNNAYTVFKKLEQLFFTGPSGTNVMDLVIYLWYP